VALWIGVDASIGSRSALDPAPDPALGRERADFVDLMSGNRTLADATPLASVYAGHQFGVFVPQLGDGRALLIAEIEARDGRRVELQLKGAGRTPFSRFADGRAVLRSTIREYLCGDAMHHLGIPSTRALSIVGSPLPVQRETVETAAVLCRVAPSHLRFGHFELFYWHRLHDRLAPLADHLIDEFWPEFSGLPDRYGRWLDALGARTATLMAQWMGVGFCHGVMNTDNFSAIGLTIDYGPFGFMDGFDPQHICNHSDESGRYAYDQQPQIGLWNLSRLYQACVPLLSTEGPQAVEIANTLLAHYPDRFRGEMQRIWREKLGLCEPHEGDDELLQRLLAILAAGRSDFTRTFRHLARIDADSSGPAAGVREEIADLAAFDIWVEDYRARLRGETRPQAERAAAMLRCNPKYVLRNHLAQHAIERAQAGDFAEIAHLQKLLARPFDEQPEHESYAAEPPPELRRIEVSCSS
jgi:uncharacterized protein YdiU (UPF0061 family)